MSELEAILYVGHGTRAKDGKEQVIRFINEVKQKVAAPVQEISFIELTEPSIEAGIDACVRKKATKITIVPLLLFSGGHAKRDIPLAIERAKVRFPHVQFTCGRPFGSDARFITILVDLLQEQGFSQDIRERSRASILLVGRGSSEINVLLEMTKITERLRQVLRTDSVEVCYLASAKPSFESSLENVLSSSQRKVFILPYLLFTGVLIKRMQKTVAMLQTDKQISLCRYLGSDKRLIDVVADYVEEARSYVFV